MGEEQKTSIIGKAEVSKEKMMSWAKNKNNNEEYLFVMDLAWEMAEHLGIRPEVACCQISKETGYLYKNGSAAGLDASFHNPCGLKITQGGGDYVASAHMKFPTWEHGILAYLDHLSLYIGLEGYPLEKDYTLDPRHFPYLKGTAKYVEDLGGKWCPNVEYGKDIVRMVNEIKGNEVKEEVKEEVKKENEIEGGKKMLPINRSYLNGSARWGTVNVPKYIVVHYTGNKRVDTALNNVLYMNRVGENAGGSAHYYVDDTSIYQLLEDNWDSWSVGDDNGYGRFAFGINNNNQISIEMCCTSGNYRVSDKTQENCAQLVAHLLKKHGLGLDRIRRHYDASRKSCPAQFCPYNTYYPYNDGESNWAKFKQKVAKYYNGGTQTSTTTDVIYRVKLANGTQIGAYRNLDSAKALAQVNKCNVYRSTDNALIVSYVTNPNVANKTINYRVSDKTQENCAELVAHLLKKHGLGLDRIRRHYQW